MCSEETNMKKRIRSNFVQLTDAKSCHFQAIVTNVQNHLDIRPERLTIDEFDRHSSFRWFPDENFSRVFDSVRLR